jgi:hypothetical protein
MAVPTQVANSYADWRKHYVRTFNGSLYVAYNDDGANLPKDAVTVSEATGCAGAAEQLGHRRCISHPV